MFNSITIHNIPGEFRVSSSSLEDGKTLFQNVLVNGVKIYSLETPSIKTEYYLYESQLYSLVTPLNGNSSYPDRQPYVMKLS